MSKLRIHIDPKRLKEKPKDKDWGVICSRLLQENNIRSIGIETLAEIIETGHTICPAVMCGTKAADWQEQQLFMVDIDNAEENKPILTVKKALAVCAKNDLMPVFYYYTFNHTGAKPKYRLAFITDMIVTDPRQRYIIVNTLISLFPQSDKACANANRIFLGTNKKVVICDINARISMNHIQVVSSSSSEEARRYVYDSAAEMEDSDLNRLKNNYDFLSYLVKRNGRYRESENTVKFENCEICGHKNNLRYYKDTNTFYCFSSRGEVGGSIIDYLMITEELTLKEAIDKLKYELCDQDWKNPMPLEDFKLPAFPVEHLPDSLKDWVIAVAENTATPVDMAAVSALALVAASVQGKLEIKGKADYYEPLNLYILIIAKSGERKSAIIRLMTKVIYQYERDENNKRLSEIDMQEAQITTLKQQIKGLEKSGKYEEINQKRVELQALERNKTKLLRLIADDATPEALASLLADNKGVLTIISTEGGMFDTLNGKYSDKVSIDTVLKAHAGDPIRIDRIGRESETIENPALTMLLAAQENVLTILLNNEVFKSRGLTARILYSKPTSKVGTREFNTPEIPSEFEEAYNELILDLLNIPSSTNRISVIKLDEAAFDKLERFFDWVEPQLTGALEHTEGWGGKFIGTTLRIAGILHCVEHRKSASKVAVSAKTMQKAIKIARYFLKHAKYAYSLMGADKALQGAKAILKKLKQQEAKELTKYQIFRLCRGSFSKADDVLPSLEILIEHGFLRMRTNSEPTGGRPKASIYILHPQYFKK